ncbi:MAG TPA: GNAT family N-acetyltransferase [Novimethylophilus sp.]|jgi:ribosomal protein S18 acetylase RimI-like enzyme|uniref:GNAT family N-acetyltransferase n=1 Tax=Novimethylophilus sp. TaxID=2137426 RepID=UPI002F3E2FB8
MITIRPYHPADAQAVEHIVTACTRELRKVYRPNPDAPPASPSTSSATERLVAVDDAGPIVGVAKFAPRTSALYTQGIAVAPDYRRRGVAGTLLKHISALAADRQISQLELATIKETGNVSIFLRLGFLVVEEHLSERFVGADGQAVAEVMLKRHVP